MQKYKCLTYMKKIYETGRKKDIDVELIFLKVAYTLLAPTGQPATLCWVSAANRVPSGRGTECPGSPVPGWRHPPPHPPHPDYARPEECGEHGLTPGPNGMRSTRPDAIRMRSKVRMRKMNAERRSNLSLEVVVILKHGASATCAPRSFLRIRATPGLKNAENTG